MSKKQGKGQSTKRTGQWVYRSEPGKLQRDGTFKYSDAKTTQVIVSPRNGQVRKPGERK